MNGCVHLSLDEKMFEGTRSSHREMSAQGNDEKSPSVNDTFVIRDDRNGKSVQICYKDNARDGIQ